MTISIGIAAYNAEKNMKPLLISLLQQRLTNAQLLEIIVHSDASSDATIAEARSVVSDQVVIIASKRRKGFAGAVKTLLAKAQGDVVLLLNDDIKITDHHLIQKMIAPIARQQKVGLVSGNPQPMPAKNFIEKANQSSFRAYDKMRYHFKNGHNKYTCDGKILALSRPFIDTLQYPKHTGDMGNVDVYLYFACLASGFFYKHVKQAVVWFHLPSTIKDYLRLNIRNNSNLYLLEKQFGALVPMEYKKPRLRLFYYACLEFSKNPLGCGFILATSLYTLFEARIQAAAFNPTWEVVTSTKDLI